MKRTKTSNRRSIGLKHGFRSGLEEVNSQELGDKGIPFLYEGFKIPYRIERDAKYTPDFLLLNNAIVVETKGQFKTEDRQKHKLIKEQHPDIDIRFVFSNPNQRISKQSKTTYAMWCEKEGFRYAARSIPEEWVDEPLNEKSRAALHDLINRPFNVKIMDALKDLIKKLLNVKIRDSLKSSWGV